MKYILSFLSGFLVPTLFLVLLLITQFGGLAIFVFGPWMVGIILLTLFILKYLLKDKYSFWMGFYGLLLPVSIFLVVVSWETSQNSFSPEKTAGVEANQLIKSSDIKNIDCGNTLTTLKRGENLICIFRFNKELSPSKFGMFKVELRQVINNSSNAKKQVSPVIGLCSIATIYEYTCTFNTAEFPADNYEIQIVDYTNSNRIVPNITIVE